MGLWDLADYQLAYEYGFRCWLHFCQENTRFFTSSKATKIRILKTLPVDFPAQETLRSAYWKIHGAKRVRLNVVPPSLSKMEWVDMREYFSEAREQWQQADTTEQSKPTCC